MLSEDFNGHLMKEKYTNNPIYVDKEGETSLMIKENLEKITYSIEGTIGQSYAK